MKIYCVNTESYIDIKGGESLRDILSIIGPLPFSPICARVNNRTEPLSFQVFMPKQVEFICPSHPSSMRVYVRSLCMMLYRAVSLVHPEARLCIEHSISRGHYCRLLTRDTEPQVITPDVEALDACMRSLVARALPFERHERLTRDAIEIFRSQGLMAKVNLLESLHELYTAYYTLDSLADTYYGPLAPCTADVPVFALEPYEEGMLLLPPDIADMTRAQKSLPQKKMYRAFKEHLRFNAVVGVGNVGELNRAVEERRSSDLINLSEALHSQSLAAIAHDIRKRGARFVLIAGPSSSGKTTTCKRLAIQLMTCLLRPKMISLDDYFVNRDQTPLDPVSGDYDFESLHALDLPLLSAHLKALLRGEEINLPTYSFELGRRVEKKRPLRLEKDDVLLMEGIHGLNPAMLGDVPQESVFKMYVSALTTLSIDDHNWISTTDTRLLRRIVRDHKYRSTSALDTLRRWPSVRRGEDKWIFPFQENADATFNSSLLFEIAVMKEYADPLLRGVPHDAPEYSEAYRLLSFLSKFLPLPEGQIPGTSLLREFLGGSTFNY